MRAHKTKYILACLGRRQADFSINVQHSPGEDKQVLAFMYSMTHVTKDNQIWKHVAQEIA